MHALSPTRRIVLAGILSLIAVSIVVALYEDVLDRLVDRRAPVASQSTGADSFGFSFLDQPRAMPPVGFADADGRTLSLADFRGRPVLLNIWATWCVPCREEMPSLDRLQAKLSAARLQVVPLSIDRQGIPVVEKFYRDLDLTSLGLYIDRDGAAAGNLAAVGVPTTILIDREGREVGRKIGAAAWDSPEVIALLRDHLAIAAEGAAP